MLILEKDTPASTEKLIILSRYLLLDVSILITFINATKEFEII